jgi:hypothetical protein
MSDVTSECDKSTTLISYMSVVTSDLNSLSTWASDWCVNFNASKTKNYMIPELYSYHTLMLHQIYMIPESYFYHTLVLHQKYMIPESYFYHTLVLHQTDVTLRCDKSTTLLSYRSDVTLM